MKSIEKIKSKTLPSHIAIILDGNGRWAKRRGRSRSYGHRQGALNIKTVALEANELGIKVMSIFAFSTENWKRPQKEIDFLMEMPAQFEEETSHELDDSDIKIVFSGRKDRLSNANRGLIEKITDKTKDNKGLVLNVCFDYGSHDEIIETTKKIAAKAQKETLNIKDIDASTIEDHLYTSPLPAVDLLIRTSGEQRLSNYLLWQSAYAELYFTKTPWPAFKQKALRKAIIDFQKRHRRFGGIKG